MKTVDDLKKRLLQIFEDNGSNLKLSMINNEYSIRWHESLNDSWKKITNTKEKLCFQTLIVNILGNDAKIVGNKIYVSGDLLKIEKKSSYNSELNLCKKDNSIKQVEPHEKKNDKNMIRRCSIINIEDLKKRLLQIFEEYGCNLKLSVINDEYIYRWHEPIIDSWKKITNTKEKLSLRDLVISIMGNDANINGNKVHISDDLLKIETKHSCISELSLYEKDNFKGNLIKPDGNHEKKNSMDNKNENRRCSIITIGDLKKRLLQIFEEYGCNLKFSVINDEYSYKWREPLIDSWKKLTKTKEKLSLQELVINILGNDANIIGNEVHVYNNLIKFGIKSESDLESLSFSNCTTSSTNIINSTTCMISSKKSLDTLKDDFTSVNKPDTLKILSDANIKNLEKDNFIKPDKTHENKISIENKNETRNCSIINIEDLKKRLLQIFEEYGCNLKLSLINDEYIYRWHEPIIDSWKKITNTKEKLSLRDLVISILGNDANINGNKVHISEDLLKMETKSSCISELFLCGKDNFKGNLIKPDETHKNKNSTDNKNENRRCSIITIGDLKKRLLQIFEENGCNLKFSLINDEYSYKWREPLIDSWKKLTKTKEKLSLQELVISILGNDANIIGNEVHIHKNLLEISKQNLEAEIKSASVSDLLSLHNSDHNITCSTFADNSTTHANIEISEKIEKPSLMEILLERQRLELLKGAKIVGDKVQTTEVVSKVDFPPLSISNTVSSARLVSYSEASITYVTSVSVTSLSTSNNSTFMTASPEAFSIPSYAIPTTCQTSAVSSTSSGIDLKLKKGEKFNYSNEQVININESTELNQNKFESTEKGKIKNKNNLLDADSSRLCNSFHQVHIAYCKVRIAAIFYSRKTNKLKHEDLKMFFREMYRENFFKNSVLKYFVSEENSDIELSELFIQQVCGDFLKLSENASTLTVEIIKNKDVSYLYITLMNELIGLLEKLDLPYNYPKLPELTLLGNVTRDVDVYRVGDRNGCFHSMLSFGLPHCRALSGRERPTLDEINQKVSQIQNKICRRGDVVKVAEIVKELCVFYNVSCVTDLCPFESKKIREETDIPAINDFVRLQGRINAFILSFMTFRNICTLFELNQEICKMESKSSFLDLKLGPLQKQLLVYDHFKFPPNQNEIPCITTSDVFRLIWKMNIDYKKKQSADEKKKNKDAEEEHSDKIRDREKVLFSLPDFMEFLVKQHGFTEPYESGVKISSIALAISVVKKAKFGDMQHERDQIKYFNDQLRKELDLYFDHKLNEIVRSSRPPNLIEKLCGMKLFDAFKEIETMLTHMSMEISKYFSNRFTLVKQTLTQFMRYLKSVQQDALLSRIIHIVLSTGPLKVIGLDDLDILRCLGFDETIKKLLNENKKENLSVKHQTDYSVTPKSLVIETAIKWLSQNTDFTIESLFRIEKQITSSINENYECFNDLGHGPFLKFLVNNESTKHLVKLNTVPVQFGGTYTKEDVSNFIQQCGMENSIDDKVQGLKIQFNVKDPSLFHGLLDGISADCVFIYQHAVLCGTDYQKELISHSEDSLNKLAVSKINALPYLEDISQLTNWDEMFQNKLGDLKVFIKSYFSFKDVQYLFLEIQSGKFVKILKDCSIELFTEALTSRDAKRISLCLTSILCLNGQVDHAPLTLLSNRMEMFMQSTSQVSNIPDDFLLKLTLECIHSIPFHILCCVVRKLFLSPLSTIYGSQNVPCLLLKVCTNNQNFRSRVHALGFQLHVAEWIEDYSKQLNFQPDTPYTIHHTPDTPNNILLDPLVLDKALEIIDKDLKIKSSVIQDISPDLQMMDPLDLTSILKTDETKVLHECPTSNIQDDYCHKVINGIRREQFGIGVEFGEEEKKLIEIHREREGRSLQRLSNELYSKDSHFVLELIQNADDNQYIENDEKPTVAFIVEHEQIIILNNEKGFSERDIKALCDVGKSTKGIHRKGYIGQKGIGFKSVFRVTDMPEIHSNGYHIKFDASSGSNGYILPNWIYDWTSDKRSSYQPSESRNYGWKTQIVLPLKKEMQHSKLASRFHDIHSSLLLFLNRLHTIIIDDKVSNIVKVMEREHVDKNIVRLSNNNDSHLWFVVEKEISIDIREDVKSTNIAVAFPFNNKLNTEALPVQQVFAFLPLRSYGFKFIIQADFEVPSSREDIDKDSAWNQYILQQLPKLTVEAFHSFKVHQYFKGLDGVVEYLKFMDLEDNVFGVFKQVSQQMIKSLQREACLPVMPRDVKKDKNLTWVIPNHIVFSQQQVFKVISPEILQEKLGLYYLSNEFASAVSKRVLSSLGVCEIKFEQLIEVCKLVVQGSSQLIKNSDKMHQWIGNWLHIVYTNLQSSCDCSQKTFDIIRSLQIFPMTNGSMMSLKENVAFFPVYNVLKSGKKKKDERKLDIIENDLNILSHNMMESLDQVEQEQVKKLLCDLGVKYITPSDLIHNHIIPSFKSGIWKNKPEKLVVAYVVYLEDQYRINPDIFDITEASQWIMLLTNKGFRSPLDPSTPIYLTPQYGNEINLKTSFPSGNWTLIDDCYISGCSQKQKESMFSFMLSLSLKKFFFIRKSTKSLHVSDLVGSSWSSFFQTWDKTLDETYVIHDLECPELNQIISAQILHEVQKLLLVLDQHWNLEFSKYDLSRPSCLVESVSGEFIAKTYSSVLLKMRSAKWLPDNLEIPKLHQPLNLFINNEKIFSLMGRKVNYLSNQVKSKDFILNLGVQTDVKFESFVKEFKMWREESLFSTSYDHLINIYKYFEKHQSAYPSIISELKQFPLVFLADDRRNPNSTSVVEGKFLLVNNLCWEDPSGILSNFKEEIGIKRTLNSYYPKELMNFFVNKLGVNRYPSIQEYINLASSIASKTVLPDKVACEKLFNLFSVLGHMFIMNNKLEELNEWSFAESTEERKQQYEDLASFVDLQLLVVHGKDFMEERIFPTSTNTFCSISDLPLLAENNTLAKVFQESRQVSFIFYDSVLNMINSNKTKRITDSCHLKILKVMIFFKACGIRHLLDVYMEPEITTTLMERGCSKWEKTLHDISPVVQRYLKAKIPLVYNQLCSKTFHKYLKSSTMFTVEKLEAVYRLSDRSNVNISQVKIALVLDAEAKHATVYVTSEYAEEKSKFENILDEILSLFVGNNEKHKEELLDFILTYVTVKNKEECLKRKNIPEIPSDEEIWHYSEPKLLNYGHTTAPVVKELPNQNATLPIENTGLKCWPPRNPAGLGFIAKPESIKNAEKEILDKWKIPEYPECAENNRSIEPLANHLLERNSSISSEKTITKSDYIQVNPTCSSNNENSTNLRQINTLGVQLSFPPNSNDQSSEINFNISLEKTNIQSGYSQVKQSCNYNNENSTSLHQINSLGAQSSLPSNSDKVNNLTTNPNAINSVICDERLCQWKKWNQSNQIIRPNIGLLPFKSKNNFNHGKLKSYDFDKFEKPVIEQQYEDLPVVIQGNLKDFEKSKFDKEKSDRSGYFGEFIVYRHIQETYKDEILKGKVKIFWLNEREETGDPYDIRIEFTDQKVESEDENLKSIYIEVKTSYLDGKKEFEISANQLRFAFDQKANLHLYRVTGLNENLRIRRLVNLSMYMDCKSVQLYMVL